MAGLLDTPHDVHRHLAEKHLHVSDHLVLAQSCCTFRELIDEILAKPTLSLGGAVVTDKFLTFLLRRVPEGKLKSLDVTDCEHLTRAGLTRALRRGHTSNLTKLTAHKCGGASWSNDELRRLVSTCPSLRELHADCRTRGVGANQLQALLSERSPILPRRLVLQRESVQDVGDVMTIAGDASLLPAPPAAMAAPTADEAAVAAVAPLPSDASEDELDEAAEELVASGASAFGEALSRCKSTLEELDVRGCDLDEAGVAQVSRLLKAEGNGLRRLLLPGAGALAVPARMRLFALALGRSERLELLQLGCSSINSEGGKAIATALHANSSLRQLELQHNPLLDAGAAALGNALGVNRSLQTLAIPFTGLGDTTCFAIARALKKGSSLVSLDLAGNRLTASGVTALADALPSSAQLEILVLTANPIGDKGALSLAAALPAAAALRSLRLDGCNISSSPCGRLAASLASSHVAELDLSSNEVGDMGAWELAWRLPECTSVRELRLASNEIEEDGGAELLTAMNASAHLARLDLRGNRLVETEGVGRALKATGRCNMAFQLTPRARGWACTA